MQAAAARFARWLKRWGWAGSVLVLALAVSGLTATGAIFALQANAEQREQARRQAALAAARQQALDLTSLSYKTADKDVRLVLQGAVGDFKRRFSSQASGLKQVLKQAQVVSSGEVRGAGIASADRDSATVLLAMAGTVKNKQSPQGSPRQYRFNMTLERRDGHWLLSRMRILP